jgi:hypothetical protein
LIGASRFCFCVKSVTVATPPPEKPPPSAAVRCTLRDACIARRRHCSFTPIDQYWVHGHTRSRQSAASAVSPFRRRRLPKKKTKTKIRKARGRARPTVPPRRRRPPGKMARFAPDSPGVAVHIRLHAMHNLRSDFLQRSSAVPNARGHVADWFGRRKT